MRVAELVAATVMPTVPRRPHEYRTLGSHAPSDAERATNSADALEAMVCEEAVKPQGNAKSREDIHRQTKPEIERADNATPKHAHRHDKRHKRSDNRRQRDKSL